MSIKFKKKILASTALIAVFTFSVKVANAADLTLTTAGIWAETGDVAGANALDNVDAATFALTVKNDCVADDGSGDTNTFVLGSVTGTAGSLIITTDAVADLSVTVDSVNLTGAGAVSITNMDANNATADVIFTNDFTTGGTLTMSNTETDADKDVTASVGGDIDVTGVTILTAASFADSKTEIDVTGNAAFIGAVELNAGAGAGSDAILEIGGNTIDFTGGLTLNDGNSGLAKLNLTGTGVIVTGVINGSTTGEGTIDATGADGVTFSSALGETNELKVIDLSGVGGNDVFSSTVRARSIVFKAANTVTFNDTITSTGTGIDFAGFDGTISLASGNSITGSVDNTGVAGKGTLNLVGGTQTVSGTVGSTNSLLEINAGSNDAVSDFSGTVNADDFNIIGTGTVNFTDDVTGNLNFVGNGFAVVANGKTITGNVSNDTDAFGTITFTGDGTVDGNFGAALNELKAITMNSSSGRLLSITGDATAADITSIAGNTVNVIGTFTIGAGQQLNSTILTDMTSGTIVAGGAVTVAADTVLNLTAGPVYVSTGDSWTIIDGSVAGGVGVAALTAGNIVNTALLTYTQDITETDSLVVTVARAAVDSALSAEITSNDITVNESLDIIKFNGGNTLDTIQMNLMNEQDVHEIHNILESLTPTVDGSFVTVAMNVVGEVQSLAGIRMSSLRSGDEMTGISAGVASSEGVNLWFQGYGQIAGQDTSQSIKGYDSDTWGWTIGTDAEDIFINGEIGIALNYGLTNVESKNANSTSTEMRNYGINFYGNLDLGQKTFVTGQVGYAYNKISSERYNVGGVGGLTADSNYHGDQFSMKADVGRNYMTDYGITITPSLSAAYTFLCTPDYTETGAGAANLFVDSNKLNFLNLGIGINASWKLKNSNGSMIKPLVHASFSYDAISDEVGTIASFIDLPNSSFKTNGAESVRSSIDIGTGFTYSTLANWDILATYDYTYKADYAAHSGVLRAISKF